MASSPHKKGLAGAASEALMEGLVIASEGDCAATRPACGKFQRPATVKRLSYESHDQLRRHLADFV
ncbi:hypothetical protein FJ943_22695 [Mesorhizobium sp. B2-3-10]|nr:hypothetical protein FJ943_22695 [Mesorhizobium sp. B2-3-10]